MHTFSRFLATVGLLGVAVQAQTVTVPQAGAGLELPSSTSYFVNPCLNASCSIRVQYFYAASNFINQGIAGPIVINSLSWRANGGALHTGCVSHPSVQVDLSTAVAGAILAPNATFALNHGANLTNVFGPAPVTTAATTGTSPNSPIVAIALTTPFVYDPTQGDLCVDVSNQGGSAGTLLSHDFSSTLGAAGARVWDFTPNAVMQTPASGNNQPGMAVAMDIGYGTTSHAMTQKYGDACYTVAGNVHEFFANGAAFDLASTGMSLVFTGTGYTAVPALTTYVAPTPAATNLALGDDTQTTVTLGSALNHPSGSTGSLVVCSNGFVSVALGNGTSFSVSEAAWRGWSQTSWACWKDFNPAAGGQVKFEEVGSVSYVTWDGVVDFGGTTPNTWQIQFDRSNGNVHFQWGAMSGAGGAMLVGFKCGGTSISVPSMDISTALPATFPTSCDQRAIDLCSPGRPVAGATISLNTSQVPAGALLSAVVMNFAAIIPQLNLVGLGAPNCFQHIALGGAATLGLGFTSSWSLSFSIPAGTAYLGTNVFAQSAAFVPPANPLGVTTSNGLRLLVGNQ